MSDEFIQIVYDCGEIRTTTYVSRDYLEKGVPFPRAIREATERAGRSLHASLARDLLGVDPGEITPL